MSLNTQTEDGPPHWIPQVTASSVYAICYKGGVVLAANSGASFGRMARFKNINRIIRVNSKCVLAFNGDWGDFQHVVIEVECAQQEHYNANPRLELTPKMVHAFLADYLYYRRRELDPLWDTVVVAGLEPSKGEEQDDDSGSDDDGATFRSKFSDEQKPPISRNKPFIGVVTQRGAPYEVKTLATGFGSFLTAQMLETEWIESGGELDRDTATRAIKEALKTAYCRDCDSGRYFNIAYIDEIANGGGGELKTSAVLIDKKSIDANWAIVMESGQFT